jgi:hypothetical protein
METVTTGMAQEDNAGNLLASPYATVWAKKVPLPEDWQRVLRYVGADEWVRMRHGRTPEARDRNAGDLRVALIMRFCERVATRFPGWVPVWTPPDAFVTSHTGRCLSLHEYRDDLVGLRPPVKELLGRGRAFKVARRRERPGPLPWRKSMRERIAMGQSLKPALKGCPWGFAPEDGLRYQQLRLALKAVPTRDGGISDDSDDGDSDGDGRGAALASLRKQQEPRSSTAGGGGSSSGSVRMESFEGIPNRVRMALTKKLKKPPTKLQLQVAVKKEERAWKARKAKEEAAIGKLAHMSEEDRALVRDVVWQTKVTRGDLVRLASCSISQNAATRFLAVGNASEAASAAASDSYSMSQPSGNNLAIDFLLSRLRKILPEVARGTGRFESAIQKYQIDLSTESGQAVAKAERRLLQAEEDVQYDLQFSKDLLSTATRIRIVAISHDSLPEEEEKGGGGLEEGVVPSAPSTSGVAVAAAPAQVPQHMQGQVVMKSTSRFMKVKVQQITDAEGSLHIQLFDPQSSRGWRKVMDRFSLETTVCKAWFLFSNTPDVDVDARAWPPRRVCQDILALLPCVAKPPPGEPPITVTPANCRRLFYKMPMDDVLNVLLEPKNRLALSRAVIPLLRLSWLNIATPDTVQEFEYEFAQLCRGDAKISASAADALALTFEGEQWFEENVKRGALWAEHAKQGGAGAEVHAQAVVRDIRHARRLVRLEMYRATVVRQRQARRRQDLMVGIREWGSMMEEDRAARKIRPYLTCPQAQFEEISEAFDLFDKDHSGALSASEFQQLMFELGETMTDQQVKEGMLQIDADGSGLIEFHEFVVWWLCDGAAHTGDAATKLNLTYLNTKLAAKKKVREAKEKARLKMEAKKLEAAVLVARRKQQFGAAALRAAQKASFLPPSLPFRP